MEVDGVMKHVKLDSGARCTVAGMNWTNYGKYVDFVEDIGGILLDGCLEVFLVGVDIIEKHKATLGFRTNELTYRNAERTVVIPFRIGGAMSNAKVATVRMTAKTYLGRSTVTPVEISVTTEDGEIGIFLPTVQLGSVILAATVMEARNGKGWAPAINANSGRVKLPSKKELGTWIPLDDDVEIPEMHGIMEREQRREWLREIGDSETPLDNEDEVHIGLGDEGGRELIRRPLRVYRKQVKDTGDCPPTTALNIEHHIDTGDAAPTLLKRRRQAQTKDAIVETNVRKMLGAGVIEDIIGH
ncbi:hypothetical protein PC120_g20648 [Phytophthora cactorum]|nr:hypothetical protein PC120_g20648 [Phytophthora cactorum]